MANVLLRPPTEDTGVGRYCHARELLSPPSHDLHGGQATVTCPQHISVRWAVVYSSQGHRLAGASQWRVRPVLSLANTTPSPGLAEGLAWMAHAARALHYPPAPRGWRAPLAGRDGQAGPLHGPRQSPAPRAGPPPSTFCLTTQWCGPPTRRGSRRSPSTIQLSACG